MRAFCCPTSFGDLYILLIIRLLTLIGMVEISLVESLFMTSSLSNLSPVLGEIYYVWWLIADIWLKPDMFPLVVSCFISTE